MAGIRPAIAEEVRRAYSTGAMQATIARPDTRLCLVEVAGQLVGFAQIRFDAEQPLVQSAHPAELERLYVQRPFTRQRIGAQLLSEAEQLAAHSGATALWCSAWIHNMRALRFYERQGYRQLGSCWFEMDRERHENRVLAKTL